MRTLLKVLGAALLIGSLSALASDFFNDVPFKLMWMVVGVVMLVAGLRKPHRHRHNRI